MPPSVKPALGQSNLKEMWGGRKAVKVEVKAEKVEVKVEKQEEITDDAMKLELETGNLMEGACLHTSVCLARLTVYS